MPKVVLEFEVTDKGLSGVPRLLTETESALRRVGKAGGDSARDVERYAGASGKAGLSMTVLRRGINDVALAFGQSSPQITGAALGLGHVIERMSGVSTSAKILGGAVIAAGTTVAYLFSQFRESERVAQRFGAIDQAVRSLDVGRISSALQEVNLEFATFGRQGEFWIGRVAAAADRARRTLLGIPSAFREASASEERLRTGLQAATSLQRGTEAAGFRQEMAGLDIQARQKGLQSQLAQGMANPLAIELSKGFTRLNIQEAYDAAVEALDFQLQKAIEASHGRGTLDIERPAIEARYQEQIAKLRAQKAMQEFDTEEQARQQAETVRGQRESTRAFGAGLAQENQAARLKAMQADLDAAKKIQAENDAFLKRIGVPAWLLPGVDPRAKQFIEEQKNTLIMGIDETLQKNLSAINQLKTTEEERQRLVQTANETASMQRRQANEDAIREINEMYDAAAKLRDELWKAGEAVRLGLSASLDEALAKIRAGALQIGGMGAGAGAGAGTGVPRPAPTKPWGGEGREPGSVGGPPPWSTTGGGGDVGGPVYVGPPGQVPTWETPPSFRHGGFVPHYKHGGFVQNFGGFPAGSAAGSMPSGFAPMRPWGPQNAIDREIPIMASPGELILNEQEQAVVRSLTGSRAGGGDLVVNVTLNNEAIIRAVRVPLNQAIANGQITIRG